MEQREAVKCGRALDVQPPAWIVIHFGPRDAVPVTSPMEDKADAEAYARLYNRGGGKATYVVMEVHR